MFGTGVDVHYNMQPILIIHGASAGSVAKHAPGPTQRNIYLRSACMSFLQP